MKVDGACQGPFVFSSPSEDDIYTQNTCKEIDNTTPNVSDNGGDGKMGDFFTEGKS